MDIVGYTGTFTMQGNDIIREVAEDVLMEDTDWSPLVTFMSQINGTETFSTGQYKFEWQESIADKPYVTCTTGIASASAGVGQAVTFNIPDVRVGNRYYQSTTRQTFQVTAVSGHSGGNTTQCTIVRVPLTAATTAVAGTPLLVSLGNHIVEGAFYTLATGRTPNWHFNYVQRIFQQVSTTKDNAEEQTYHGSQFESDKVTKLQQFRADQERLILFGTGFLESMTQTIESGKSSTGFSQGSSGIEETITNVQTYSGSLDETTLDSFMRNKVWGSRNSGNKEKIALCGPNVLQAINGFAKNRLMTMEGADEYGLDISTYVAYGGRRLHLMEEREFVDNPDYADAMWVLDVDEKVMRIMQRGSYFTKIFPIDPTDQDITGIGMKSVFGLRMRGAQNQQLGLGKHAILRH